MIIKHLTQNLLQFTGQFLLFEIFDWSSKTQIFFLKMNQKINFIFTDAQKNAFTMNIYYYKKKFFGCISEVWPPFLCKNWPFVYYFLQKNLYSIINKKLFSYLPYSSTSKKVRKLKNYYVISQNFLLIKQ